MAQTFDKTKPVTGTTVFGSLYAALRDNQNGIATHHSGTAAPSNPDTGWTWYDTTSGRKKTYNGTSWVEEGTLIADVPEVVAARGSKTSLDGRLDVSMNEDGTMKSSITAGNEWIDPSLTPTYISASSFTVTGNQTDIYTWGRRLKVTISGSPVYCTVKSSAYTSVTTVTIFETNLTSGMTKVEHSFISNGSTGSNPRSRTLAPVSTFASLPVTQNEDGDIRTALDVDADYAWDDTDKAWIPSGRAAWFAHAQATPAMTVKIRRGLGYVGATLVEKTSETTSSALTAPTTNPRIDLLTMDSAGTLAWTAGTEAASPSPPTHPTDKLPICEVYLRVGSTGIYNTDPGTNAYIRRDVRPLLNLGASGNDDTITTADHKIGASTNIDLVSWLTAKDLTLEINGTAVRVNASSSAPQRCPIINSKGRIVADATTATTTLSGGAGARYIFSDSSATATTFTLANSTSSTPGTDQVLVGVAYWDGAAITHVWTSGKMSADYVLALSSRDTATKDTWVDTGDSLTFAADGVALIEMRVEAALRINHNNGGANGMAYLRLYLDGTTELGRAECHAVAGSNVIAASRAVITARSVLSAGSHTIKTQMYVVAASDLVIVQACPGDYLCARQIR